ncbi:MAG: tetratricopeptide repeat protein [Clostridia bacterium]|nr:tetratricopeptide repeat protein [Clostridia bacterium]
MGFFDGFKVKAALMKHQKGKKDEALAEYTELYQNGVVSAAYMLPYSVLLLKMGGEDNYLLVKEVLKKAEKAPDMTPDRKQQLFVNYAVANYKLGEIDKAINLLEASHKKAPCGMTYQALGFLYIEKGDQEKALEYNQEALEYDDEDPVVLDNLGQLYYRLMNDKEKAREYFDKAYELKDTQIDTNYFLALYDIEDGKKEEAVKKLNTALEGNFSPLNHATPDGIRKLLAEIK